MTEPLVTVPRTLDRGRAHAYLAWLAANVADLGGTSTAHALRLGVVASLAVRAGEWDAWRAHMTALWAPDVLDALAVAAVGILEPPREGEVLPEPFATLLAAEATFAAAGYAPGDVADFVVSEIAAGPDALLTPADLLDGEDG